MILNKALENVETFFNENNYSQNTHIIAISATIFIIPLLELMLFTTILAPYPIFIQFPVFMIVIVNIAYDLVDAHKHLTH